MTSVIYAVVMAAVVLGLWAVMNAWGRRVWGKAYDKPLHMGEMMEKVGVEPDAMANFNMRGRTIQIARTCAECKHEDLCVDVLDGKRDDAPSTFCPNAPVFESLKKQ
jgi:Family of unknown function (DUF6455)